MHADQACTCSPWKPSGRDHDACFRKPSSYTEMVSTREIWVGNQWLLIQWGDSLIISPRSVTDPMLDHLFFLSINIYWALTVYKALNYLGTWYVLVGKVDTASSLMNFTIIWEGEEGRRHYRTRQRTHTHTHTLTLTYTHTHIHTHTYSSGGL